MLTTDRKVTAIVTWMTALLAGLVGLGLPLAYFGISYSNIDAALRAEAKINSRIVTELINANPDFWRFEELRLAELLRKRPGKRTPEIRQVRALDNTIVVRNGEDLPWPMIIRRADLWDSGRKVGVIEITRSLRPLLARTAFLAFLGALAGTAGIFTLRIIPLRRLRDAVKALSEEKERAQVTLRSIGDGVITTDTQGKVRLMNGVAEQLTGWSQEDAAGRPLAEVFRIENALTRRACESPADQVFRELRTVELANDTILIAKDGTEREIADSGAPIRGEDGSVVGVVLVFRDVADKKKLREERQRADKLESVGILAGGIAHDFNNFLSQIMGNISMAQLSPSCDDDQQHLLEKADKACNRARDLTRQLLTFAKGGAPVKEAVSLDDLIRTSVDFALTGSMVRAEIAIAGELPPVNIDSGQINQVINNLVINAIDAMPDGGVIAVSAERVLLGTGEVPVLTGGAYVLVSVRDHGIGIAREALSKIFDPYFTTKQQGSGLGLATSYSIIKKHGGHIEAESWPGRGSLFRFYLPALSATSVRREPMPSEGIIHGSGRILVMDDDEDVLGTAGRILQHLGYKATLTTDGVAAIKAYRTAMGTGMPFDAVLLDLTVPGGMGGKEAVGKLRELAPDLKAIVTSGYADDLVMSDHVRFGFSDVISKPYGVKELGRVLHRVLGEDANQ